MLIKNINKKIPDFIVCDNNYVIIFKNIYYKLNNAKNKINNNEKSWENLKKLTNPYELIYIPKDKINIGIANYNPVSRSYFKLIELIHNYNLIDNTNNKKILCIAEGPGGFIEALNNYLYNTSYFIYGYTLYPSTKFIPSWDKLKKNIPRNSFNNIKLDYGDLYNINNIKYYINDIDEKLDFITADGGFDYSEDFINQEKMSSKILFCEITMILSLQKINGNMICKLFDTFSNMTLKLIYIIYCLYDEVHLTKPKTSRAANSEKYIVAKGFNGINPVFLNSLYNIINNWEEYQDISNINLEHDFLNLMLKYNTKFINNQISVINKTINFINNKTFDHNNSIKEQIINAKQWCNKYNVNINYNSKYFTNI